MSIEVLDAGWSTTIQDRGRPGLAHLGVTASGAADPRLAALVNRLVGNPVDAAVFETAGGLSIRPLGPVLVASSVAAVPETLRAGESFRVPRDPARVFAYLAIRGGLAVEMQLGSRSTDAKSGLAAAHIAQGSVIPIGPEPDAPVTADFAPIAPPSSVIRISHGPRLDWFDEGAWDLLTSQTWTVAETSRVGVRLRGAHPLRRSVTRELPSEGLVRGAIQVPADGQPLMMSTDHPTTGGYPVIAVVESDDVAALAQQHSGADVRLVTYRR